MSKRTPGQMFLEPVLFVCAVFLISCFTVKLMSKVEPAMVFRNLVFVEAGPLKARQTVHLSFDYDKRADCAPPHGSGDFYFRIYSRDPDGSYRHFIRVDVGNAALEAAGQDLHATIDIDLPDLVSGVYALAVRGVFQCEGEWTSQTINPEALPFRIGV
ncbi:hypothetical protein [Hyphomicrobium sp.]|uniref:hypothetical protein n=1 Tax=Hyphomicrobium sp. TaxID=82 RepID=UPI001D97D449|nr:hypothetical protein [Hyphomicrobium sp.]MBY0559855.1 hypothetical protein [Hyphomicrobium sp.]